MVLTLDSKPKVHIEHKPEPSTKSLMNPGLNFQINCFTNENYVFNIIHIYILRMPLSKRVVTNSHLSFLETSETLISKL